MGKGKIEKFQDLVVWQKAHEFVLLTYRNTMTFPSDEKFGLISQMRRAAVSIAANLAEGFIKHGLQDKIRFYNIAQGSLEESRYYPILAKDLDYLKHIATEVNLADQTGRLLNGLISSIKQSSR